MTLACPECGTAAPRGVTAGKAYACPGCRNPVLPADVPLPAPAPPPPAPARAESSKWPLAVLAFVVLGAAYFGAYELLTAQAKRDRDALRRLHGDAITTFEAPRVEASPEDPAAYREYLAARERWEDRQRHDALVRRIDVMFGGLLAAYALQTALTAWVVVRALRRSRARPAGGPPRGP